MNWNLEALANLGEIIGAIAVVISLVYLAVQIRQSNQSQRTENYARALDRFSTFQSLLSQDAAFSVIYSKGVADIRSLTPIERIQFTWSLFDAFGTFEFLFHAAESRSIPEQVWQRWSATAAWWLSYPGVRDWWHARPVPFSEGFSTFVEQIIRDNPTAPDVAEKWKAFVETGYSSQE